MASGSTSSNPQGPDISVKQPWVDSKFSSCDHDVEFKSSDGVIFQLHRIVLGVTTGGFPGTDSEVTTNGEIVPLTEPANVLEILFAFLYPKPPPVLRDINFDLLLGVAEAAAKYEVFSAVELCNERLLCLIPQYAPEILDHAIKHDYQYLLKQTLPHFTLKPLLPIMDRLKPQSALAYARYHDAWRSIFTDLTQTAISYTDTKDCDDDMAVCMSDEVAERLICLSCRTAFLKTIGYLQTISDIKILERTLQDPSKDPNLVQIPWHCDDSLPGEVSLYFPELIYMCQSKIDALPSFSTYLGLNIEDSDSDSD